MERFIQQRHGIGPDRQRHGDELVDAQHPLAGLVPRHIGLLPTEFPGEIDLTQLGVFARLREQGDDPGMQVGRDRGGGHVQDTSRLVRYA